MDFWGAFMFFLLIFLILSCCGYCCTSKKRGAVLSTPVVVTSTTHTTTGGYPVTQMPSSGGVPANVYAASYPVPNMTGTSMGMPMPPQPPMGYQTTQYPPYPPMGVQTGGANMNPPSYDVAVHGVGMGVGNTVPYEKQAPYNPNYSAQ